jgi:hypothetical protein
MIWAAFFIQVKIGSSPGMLHHTEWIRSCLCIVNDQTSFGALSGCLFVFIGPPSIVGHGVALKNTGIRCTEAGIIHHHQHYFPLHIYSRIVVPVILRGHYTVARKYEFIFVERYY